MTSRAFVRTIPSLCAIVVGLASFALSFVALRDVAVQTQAVPAWAAWLVPVVIDGGVICGSAVIWSNSYLQRKREFLPFAFTGGLVAVSVVVNTAHAGPSLLGKCIAALPPLVLLGSLELVAGQHRRDAEREIRSAQTCDHELLPVVGEPGAASTAGDSSNGLSQPRTPRTAARKPAQQSRTRSLQTSEAGLRRADSDRPAPRGTSAPTRPLRVAAEAPAAV